MFRAEIRRPWRTLALQPQHSDAHDNDNDAHNRPGPARRRALPAIEDERQNEQANTGQQRRAHDHVRFGPMRQLRQDGEIPEQIPIGPRIGLNDASDRAAW